MALSMCHNFHKKCPKHTQVCKTEKGVKCCKYKEGVCCKDTKSCCPQGTVCSEKGCQKEETNELIPRSELQNWSLPDLRKLNWEKILRCLGEVSTLGPDVIRLVKAIKSRDYILCAQIAFELLGKGVQVVQKCISANKKNEVNKFKFDWEALIKCIKAAAPLVTDVKELIAAIKEKDFAKALTIIYDLIEKGNEVVKICMEVVVLRNNGFKFDWEALLKCLKAAGDLFPEIKELIAAIQTGDFAKALEIAYKLIAEGSEVVKECMKVVIVTKNKVKKHKKVTFNWEEFIKCLMAATPVAQEILELIEAIKSGDYAKALQLVYKLIADGSELVKKCMKVVFKHNRHLKKLRPLFSLKFDWEAFLKCIQTAAPLVQEIVELIEAIKSGDYAKAIQLIYKLIADGSEVVKECMKVVKRLRYFIKSHLLHKMFVRFDWDAFLKCIMATAPVAEEIIELIDAIQKGDYIKAIQLVYKLIADGSEVIKKCMEVVKRKKGVKNGDDVDDILLNGIDWNALIQCIKSAAPLIKDVKDLIEAVKSKDYIRAIGILATLVAKGIPIVKKCLEKKLRNEGIEPNSWFSSLLDKGKKLYEKGKSIYEKGKSIYDKGKKIYDDGKKIYDAGKSIYDVFKRKNEEENKIKIGDILKIVGCAQTLIPKAGAAAGKIQALIRAAQTFNIFEAIRLIEELKQDKIDIFAACTNEDNGIAEVVKAINWKAVYNCIKASKPTVSGIIKLFKLIKEKNYEEAYHAAYALIGVGYTFIKDCIEEFRAKNLKIGFKIDWQRVLQCIQDAKPIGKDILELIKLIKAKKYVEAFAKGQAIIFAGGELIKKCFKKKKNSNDVEVNINWNELIKCLIAKLPELKKDIQVVKDLIAAIKEGNIPKALGLVYQLYQDAKSIIHSCFSKKNKITLPQFKIDWELLLQCIKDAKPIAKEILELIEAIKAKDFVRAKALAVEIIKTGNQLIKKCLQIAQKIVW